MNEIELTNHDGEPTVDSITLAEQCEIQHKNLLELLNAHEASINEAFGRVAFETRPFETPGGSQKRRVAYLTESQATFVITLFKNTPPVVRFKLTLVKKFNELRQAQLHNCSVGLFLQEQPKDWGQRFPKSFFKAVMDCYRLDFEEGKTPQFVGHFINKYIYEPLLENLSDELKARRKKYCEESGTKEKSLKLHQFLQEHCEDALNRQISNVETLLAISCNEAVFKEHFHSRFEGIHQLQLEFQTAAERKKALKSKSAA